MELYRNGNAEILQIFNNSFTIIEKIHEEDLDSSELVLQIVLISMGIFCAVIVLALILPLAISIDRIRLII